jgi:hypothetical protein
MVIEIELFESTNMKALWTVMETDKLLGVNFILILNKCLNDKFVKVNNKDKINN